MVEKFGEGPENPPENTIIDFESFKKNKGKKELMSGSEFTIPNLGGAANFGYETKLPWVNIVRGETGHGTRDLGIIKEGKTITVLGASNEFGVLCRYNSGTKKGGTELEDGALFFVNSEELLFWPILTELQEKEKKRKDEEVKRILGEK